MNQSSQAIRSFSQVAAGFCAWCEGDSLGPRPELRAAIWLAKLHAGAMELPSADGDDGSELAEIPTEQREAAERNLRPFRGWYYRTVFDPAPTLHDAPVMGDVGDDLVDTYKDVKLGLLLFVQGRTEEAVWNWAFSHRIHWGCHVVGALAALQAHEAGRGEKR